MTRTFARMAALLGLALLMAPRVGAQTWAEQLGTVGGGSVWVSEVVTDRQGNVYVAGNYSPRLTLGAFTLNGGGLLPGGGVATDGFVAKRSAAGQWLWASSMGGTHFDYIGGLAVDTTGTVFISGSFQEAADFGAIHVQNPTPATTDLVVASLSAQGQWQWVTTAPSTTFAINAAGKLLFGPDGNLYVAGTVQGRTTFGTTTLTTPQQDGLVASITPQGTWRWATKTTGTDEVHLRDMAFGPTGDIVVCGIFSGTVPFGATTLTSGSFYGDGLIAGLDVSGAWQWGVGISTTTNWAEAAALVVDGAGNVYVGGNFNSPTTFGSQQLVPQGGDGFVARLAAGTHAWQWVKTVGSPGDDDVMDLRLDGPTGDLFVVGSAGRTSSSQPPYPPVPLALGGVNLTTAGGRDILVSRMTPAGDWQGGVFIGGGGNDAGLVMAFDAGGGVILGGAFDSPSLSVGGVTLTTAAPVPSPGRDGLVADVGRLPALLGLPAAPPAGRLGLAPNPATAFTRVTWPAPSGGPQLVRVVDLLGRLMGTYSLAAGQTALTLDLRGLAPGIYRVQCGAASQKLVVE